MEKHCSSGRVQWRQCATTWVVYEYMDTMDYTKKTTGTAKRIWTQGQEFQQNEDEYESWNNFLEKELHSLIMDQTPGKWKGKGKVSQKKAKAGAKEIPTQRHPKHLKTCHQMSSKLSASRSSKKQGICCSNA